tara:strand:+ start:1922 stop:2119 length:198 start_codon:yes stop_codon:yes gene_type:complete
MECQLHRKGRALKVWVISQYSKEVRIRLRQAEDRGIQISRIDTIMFLHQTLTPKLVMYGHPPIDP